jgi:two-component system, NtrC family, response regulator HydG
MRRLFAAIKSVARSDATVLIHGETGTGKELVADAIRTESTRRDKPFVIVDCSALPRDLAESEMFGHVRGAFTGATTDREGAFEAADGGTVFLDEIGELPLELQPLLLRALEQKAVRKIGATHHRAVDVRVIAASHRDLRIEVNAKRFRPDLFYRLNVLSVHIPRARVALVPVRALDVTVRLPPPHAGTEVAVRAEAMIAASAAESCWNIGPSIASARATVGRSRKRFSYARITG